MVEYAPYVKKYNKGSLMPPWMWPSHEEGYQKYGKKYGYYG